MYQTLRCWTQGKVHKPKPSLTIKGVVERRTVVFIRHGESMWNETFNRSKNPIYFFPRLIWAAAYELYLLIKGERLLECLSSFNAAEILGFTILPFPWKALNKLNNSENTFLLLALLYVSFFLFAH